MVSTFLWFVSLNSSARRQEIHTLIGDTFISIKVVTVYLLNV